MITKDTKTQIETWLVRAENRKYLNRNGMLNSIDQAQLIFEHVLSENSKQKIKTQVIIP